MLRKQLINVLNSGPKLKILKILSEEKPLTTSELAEKLKVKISTTLSHLKDLVDAGLIKVRMENIGGRIVKKYSLISNKIVLTVNVHVLTRIKEVKGY